MDRAGHRNRRSDGKRGRQDLKNKRVPDLEDLVVTRLAEASGRTTWEEFLAFDDLLASIGDEASQRLAFQASYPVHVPR